MDGLPSMHFGPPGRRDPQADKRYLQALERFTQRAYSPQLAEICRELYEEERRRQAGQTPSRG